MHHDASAAADDQRSGWKQTLQSDPSMRLLLGFGAFVLAVMLLSGFYIVIQQGVARAHSQWAKATRVVSGCDASGRSKGVDCLTPAALIKGGQISLVR